MLWTGSKSICKGIATDVISLCLVKKYVNCVQPLLEINLAAGGQAEEASMKKRRRRLLGPRLDTPT